MPIHEEPAGSSGGELLMAEHTETSQISDNGNEKNETGSD